MLVPFPFADEIWVQAGRVTSDQRPHPPTHLIQKVRAGSTRGPALQFRKVYCLYTFLCQDRPKPPLSHSRISLDASEQMHKLQKEPCIHLPAFGDRALNNAPKITQGAEICFGFISWRKDTLKDVDTLSGDSMLERMLGAILHVELGLAGIEIRIEALARLLHGRAVNQQAINLRICALQFPEQPLTLPFSRWGDVEVAPGGRGFIATSFHTDCFWHDRFLLKPVGLWPSGSVAWAAHCRAAGLSGCTLSVLRSCPQFALWQYPVPLAALSAAGMMVLKC